MEAQLSAGISAQMAQTQKNFALSAVKQSAQNDRQIASLLQEAVQNVPTGSRGNSVNISA